MSNPKDYTVGWICAISTEYVAAQAFLDEEHEGPKYVSPNDNNDYTLGKVGKHNIVIAVLSDGEYGTSSAASVARDMLHSFPNVRIGLMVGIGGGAPNPKHDIRLGDIVVSTLRDGEGGVFQYDFGKTIQNQSFRQTQVLNQPPTVLRTAVSGLKAQYERKGHQLESAITSILEGTPRLQQKYKRPDPNTDRLRQPRATHPSNSEASCTALCGDDPSSLILRPKRTKSEDNPTIHYGLIASANQLMKDALVRDKLAAEKDVLCFEMEAAGLMNHFPCLVVRGICDYSDSHKNKEWQGYAAMAAAAYTKDLLYRIAPNRVEAEKKITDILSGVQEGVDKLLRVQHDQEYEDILKWLTPIDYAPQQNDNIKRRQLGTGQWLLDSAEFQTWLGTGKKTLFCPGIPGAGKTIITSIVIKYLFDKFRHCDIQGDSGIQDRSIQNDGRIGIAYLYCDFRRQNEQKAEELLASLLKQLAQEHSAILPTVKELYDRHKIKQTRPSFDEISKALQSVAVVYSTVFIVIDALDECQVSNGCRTRLLSEIFNLQIKSGVSIFATSRFIPDIIKKFQGSMSVEIRASEEDVQNYLDGCILESESVVLKSCREEIKTEITKAVDGMFLLAKLHFESIRTKKTLKKMKGMLKNLPTGLKAYNQAYNEAIKRIMGQDPDTRELAKQVLSWITCAKRPLITLELQHALAVEAGEFELDEENLPEIEDIVSGCASLVIVDEETDIIRLVHYTTQEYFERTWTSWFFNAQTDITKICVTYLLFNVFEAGFCLTDEEFEARLQSHPLYDYTAENWGHHARTASTEVEQLTLNLLKSDQKVSASSQAMIALRDYSRYSQRELRQITGVHLVAYFGLKEAMVALLKNGHHLDGKDTLSRTPLWWAAVCGHEAVVKLLLKKGAKLESEDEDGWTPLFRAAENGHEAVVKLLLEKGVDSNSKSLYSQTPLFRAAENGHELVVKLLLEKGANFNSKDIYGQTPLFRAAENGHEAVVKLLLEEGTDPNSKSLYNQTPLFRAVENRHELIVKLLLEKGTDFNSKDIYSRTPLFRAAENEHESVIKLLLEKGTDPNSKDIYSQTPLWWAVENEHELVVKLLLEKGTDPNSKDIYSCTPLLQAAIYGHKAVVKLLLEKGAKLEAIDEDGRTPLLWAAERGYEAVVKLLLEKDAKPNSKDKDDRTPLLYAAERGHKAVVKLLLEKGADPNSKDRYSQTPLSYAAERGHEAVVKLLLEKGAEKS